MSAGRPLALSVSQLAAQTRVSIPHIKFYLREGILASGNLEAKKRAFYDERHVRRLRLILTLRRVAGLGLPAIRELCELLDAKGSAELPSVVAHVIDALGRREPKTKASPSSEAGRARREVLSMLGKKAIQVRPQARAVADLADALAGLRQVIGPSVSAQAFVPYLDAMCALAEQDFTTNAHLVTDGASAALAATYATVLWEPILLLLRRIAHEHVATRTLRVPRPGRKRSAR
jgi:DNA-binding transcriptional MerR regulator